MCVEISDHKILFCLLILLTLLTAPWCPDVEAQNRCDKALQDAQQLYDEARFIEVVQRLSLCVERNKLEENQVFDAHELLALSYTELYRDQKGKMAIENLLRIRPRYKTDPLNHPQRYVGLVKGIKKKIKQERMSIEQEQMRKTRLKRWLIIGSSTLAAASFFYLWDSNPEPVSPLSEPPPLPPLPE